MPETKDIQVYIRDGRSQAHRQKPALENDFFRIHELRFDQLLTLARSYYSLMKFYDLDNCVKGTWNRYLSNSETVLFCAAASMDTEKAERQFILNARGFPFNADLLFPEKLQEIGEPCPSSPLRLALCLEEWFDALRSISTPSGRELFRFTAVQRDNLSDEMKLLGSFIRFYRSDELIKSYFPVSAERYTPEKDTVVPDVNLLHTCFSAFLQSIIQIQKKAEALLPETLRSGSTEPSAALMTAFVQIMEKVQERVNLFTGKRFDFYYHTILGSRPKELTPDTAHVIIEVQGSGERHLSKGTEFRVSCDGTNYSYRADRDAAVSDLSVTRLLTCSKRGELKTVMNKGIVKTELQVSEICRMEIPAEPAVLSETAHTASAYPLFGITRNAQKHRLSETAEIGFAFSGDILLMREGRRTVHCTIEFAPTLESGQNPDDYLAGEIYRFCRSHSSELSGIRKDDFTLSDAERSLFFRIFSSLFTISLTSTAGWMEIESYTPTFQRVDSSLAPNCLVLSFEIGPESGASVPYDPQIHGGTFVSHYPILKCTLRSDSSFYGYDFFSALTVRSFTVETAVQGCRNILVYNALGLVSTNSPFMPFGPIPAAGSYFAVGCDEMKTKHITACSISAEWTGLPGRNQSLTEWYRGYGSPIRAESFVCSASVLSGGTWRSPETLHLQGLFGTDLFSQWESTISFKPVLAYRQPASPEQFSEPLSYSSSARSGFFKCTLEGPSGAFGHHEYPSLLTKTVLQNAFRKESGKAPTLPNIPYTPEITSITLNYTAVKTVNAVQILMNRPENFESTLVHIYPEGWAETGASGSSEITLIPRFDYTGSLSIGLSGTQLYSEISLLFHLSKDSEPIPEGVDSSLEWFYLSENRWKRIPPASVLSDTTEGCMKSGIVVLALPQDMSRGNSVMPGDCWWIQLRGTECITQRCRIYSVYPHAVSASYEYDKSRSENKPAVISPDSSWEIRTKIPGIAGIRQIGTSFGGRAAETAVQQRIRVSERISHRNRALIPADFERIILEKFPEVMKVKCFPHLKKSAGNRPSPGNLLIVPLPYKNSEEQGLYKPTVHGALIREIRSYLQTVSTPFAKISVDNPHFESIQIRGTVQMRAGFSNGTYLNRLTKEICEYISPWVGFGNQRHFGWELKQNDFETYLHSLEYVERFTDFSMLRISTDEAGASHMEDSCRGEGTSHFLPRYPWSCAVPVEKHHITLTAEKDSDDRASAASISDLEIGSTFIISAGEEDESREK